MAEKDVLEAGMPETADGQGALIVAQVTVALTYTHLEFVWVRASDQHSGILVRLEDNRVGLPGIFNSLVSHPAGIGHQEEPYP